ncbi:MAG: CbiX/SirB N-terminal domain-containing protein [Candidatus Riflebacteria bacterium]|nr:CbiX/SirB N-terminal domain-containing protein [Candidatus Riflebacteria bacterium]
MQIKNLLVFHGTPGNEPLKKIEVFEKNIRSFSKENNDFTICYLKSQTPLLQTALENAAQPGTTTIRVFPMFLLPGTHLNFDIPAIIENFNKKHGHINVILEKCLTQDLYFAKYISDRVK